MISLPSNIAITTHARFIVHCWLLSALAKTVSGCVPNWRQMTPCLATYSVSLEASVLQSVRVTVSSAPVPLTESARTRSVMGCVRR